MSRAALPSPGETRLLRIQEVASELGLTTRSIRYYEELGLLSPAARTEGDYRLYDASDIERLQFIKELRDDAGFSLAEIGQLLEDEAARVRSREAFAHTATSTSGAPSSRIRSNGRTVRSASSRPRSTGFAAMVQAAEERRTRLRARLADLDAAAPERSE